MDNLCHSLVGAALAECGLRRRTRYATAALVIGANLPDIDVLALFGDNGLGFRRGTTHGIPALILWPFVLTGLILAWHRIFGRRREPPLHDFTDDGRSGRPPLRTRDLCLISALAIVTHPTLDWMNVYGMRWLMPFDGTWTSADALFIVDPWLYLILGAAWIVGRSAREGQEARKIQFARRMVAFASVYIVAMMAVSAFGKRLATRELGMTNPSRRELMIAPVFLDSWRRSVMARVDGSYRFGEIDWRNREVQLHPEQVPPELELLDGQPRTPQLEALLDWARFPFARREENTIHVDDFRYARHGRSFAGVTVVTAR